MTEEQLKIISNALINAGLVEHVPTIRAALAGSPPKGERMQWRPISEAREHGSMRLVWIADEAEPQGGYPLIAFTAVDGWTAEDGEAISPTHFAEVSAPGSTPAPVESGPVMEGVMRNAAFISSEHQYDIAPVESGVREAAGNLLEASERHIFGDECLAERDALRAALATSGEPVAWRWRYTRPDAKWTLRATPVETRGEDVNGFGVECEPLFLAGDGR